MSELPNRISNPRSIQVGTMLLRVLAWIVGMAAILIGGVLSLLFIANELQEAESTSRPVLASIVAVVITMGFVALCAFVAYKLMRFAFKGPRPN